MLRVILVEDDASARQHMEQILEASADYSLSASCDCVAAGKAAIAQFDANN